MKYAILMAALILGGQAMADDQTNIFSALTPGNFQIAIPDHQTVSFSGGLSIELWRDGRFAVHVPDGMSMDDATKTFIDALRQMSGMPAVK